MANSGNTTEPIKHRYDFSFFFDVENGNPNGDPDAGNMPRTDPETGIGIVSDVCLKRRVRDYVEAIAELGDDDARNLDKESHQIFVKRDTRLNESIDEGFKAVGSAGGKKLKGDEEKKAVVNYMCHRFYDIRTFGAVMTTGQNCGQVRGPVQMCFAQSIDPVIPMYMSITRVVRTEARGASNDESDSAEGKPEKEKGPFGGKQYIPYGLYRANGFISASLAQRSGFSVSDLRLFFEALMNMFELDRSSSRGLMTSRKLYVFEHESKLGNAPAYQLFDTITAERKDGIGSARRFSDYQIHFDRSALPANVKGFEFDFLSPSESFPPLA